MAEALGSYGSDNLLIPLAAAWLFASPKSMTVLSPLIVVLLLSLPFVWLTVRTGKLTLGAAVSAALLAFVVVFQTASYWPLIPLLFFFGSSILLERMLPSGALSDGKDRHPRDVMQVLANGGVYGLVYLFLPTLAPEIIGIDQTSEVAKSLYDNSHEAVVLTRFLFGMGLVSLAVSTADTWASTVGKYFSQTAYDPFRRQRVAAGLSGGMTLAGTLAGLAGSISVAAFLPLLLPGWKLLLPHVIMISLAGFGGMLLDSLLGSLLQRQYYAHERWYDALPAGTTAERTRGVSWMSNDVVNLLSNVLICSLLGLLFVLR